MSRKDAERKRCHGKHGGRGPSSYWMHDPDLVFRELRLTPGETMLDLGCGPGDYTIKAAEIVGPSGMVLAVDASPRMIGALSTRADQEGIVNVKAMTADITEPLGIESNCVNICLLSTVLHIFKLKQVGEALFNEVRRVLKPVGRMAIIECKKEEFPFGPPLQMRLSADEITAVVRRAGFRRMGYLDLGYNYLVQFVVGSNEQPEPNEGEGR